MDLIFLRAATLIFLTTLAPFCLTRWLLLWLLLEVRVYSFLLFMVLFGINLRGMSIYYFSQACAGVLFLAGSSLKGAWVGMLIVSLLIKLGAFPLLI